ncbi:MAG: transcriptional regulator [Flavobacteriales bacterium]|nr:MAG: transcriptional regulator [Flavobacteriales bacterium]
MKLNQNCEICNNKECFLFEHITYELHKQLDNKMSYTRYKKNQQIIKEGDTVMGMYFIKKGKVKVYKESNYREQIIRLAKDGEILGHRGLGGDNTYPISATTLEDSEICFIEQGVFFKLMKNSTELSIKMMLFYADELRKTEIRLRNMAVMTVRERIAEALLLMKEAFGSKNGQETLLDVELSRKEIAELAGTYSEQASRYITEFKEDNILKLDGKKIIIQQSDKLVKIIENYAS